MDQQNAQNIPETRPGNTDIQTLEIDAAIFPFIDQGQGEPVVFLHGALTDLRMWKRHLDLVSTSFRSIAYTQRYFGTYPWGNNWPPFGIATHAADLIQFLMKLAAGPVHLVAWSYAGHAALHAALAQPELFKSSLSTNLAFQRTCSIPSSWTPFLPMPRPCMDPSLKLSRRTRTTKKAFVF